MSDQQTAPQQPQNVYPGFDVTSAGLTLLHQEAGRLLHQVIEQDGRLTALTEQGQKLAQHNRQLLAVAAAHGSGKCIPVTDESDDSDETDGEDEPTEPVVLSARREEAG